MKIGVNARLISRPYTGIGQFTHHLLKNLAELDSENEYILLTPEKVIAEIADDFPKNVKIVQLKEKSLGSAGLKKVWWEQISVPEFFVKEGVDLAFFTYPCNPWTNDWYKKGIKTVVAVHDCVPWTIGSYGKGILSRTYHAQTKKAVKKADKIITVSKTSKKAIERICEVGGEKITVVYNDVSPVYKSEADQVLTGELLRKFELNPNQFFLYCGGYDERKNVGKLIQEFSIFADQVPEFPLVLAGGKLFEDRLYASLDLQGKENVPLIKTGFLPENELKVLYQNCLAFVHLSKCEGFNIPLLEAANSGAPLILSDIDVHKEIADDHALFVDPEKLGDCALAIKKMMDKEVHKNYVKKSFELSKNYSWRASAQKLKDVLFS